MLNVTEIFKSIEGEGLTMGIPMIFVRLFGCNLQCRFCDSTFSSGDKGDQKLMTEEQVLDNILAFGNKMPKHVTITGGEPLLQLNSVSELTDMLVKRGYQVLIETNGTINPGMKLLYAKLSVSPKLSNSGQKVDYVHLPVGAYYKFVVTSKVMKDIDEIGKFLKTNFSEFILSELLKEGKIILQPDGKYKSPNALLRLIVEHVQKKNLPYRVLPQLHKFLKLK